MCIVPGLISLEQLEAFAKTGRFFFIGTNFLHKQTFFATDIAIFFVAILDLLSKRRKR